ncbi:hypothetical protein A464_1076 [Salmonella bongori N268-08]|uniref:Uncharacterized protein n=1 Tax=Salmonella bongori N268-08 TaxID=1197719 RepID=S5NDB3_SALBN|nr:hypothetical protein A464_1076 [Salmonella bongori N268-08]
MGYFNPQQCNICQYFWCLYFMGAVVRCAIKKVEFHHV